MRNAILQADLAVYGGKYRAKIWRTFANRGMGFFAGTRGAADGLPAEDFSLPPAKGTPRATLSGQVTDSLSGKPLAGALVAITGHDSGYVGDYSDVTDATGHYSIPSVFIGTYPLVSVSLPGYDPLADSVKVIPRGTTANFTITRDWASSSGGATITAFNGPDYSPDCGPAGAIDLSVGTGWGSTTGDDDATPTNVMIPKSIVVKLPSAITLSSFSVDPSATCGDPGSSSTGDYRIETSSNGTAWTTAATGTFTAADRGRLNDVAVPAPIAGVAYLRFTMLSPQVPDFATNCPAGAYRGCTFTDMTELEAFGTAD
jgi:extracellular elastinolytic metalloproteinase